jgi:hypothetical protein
MRLVVAVGLAAGLLLAPVAAEVALASEADAQTTPAPDWDAVADVDTIEIATRDEDGSPRVTTIWLVVVDGQGYIRTGDTRWFANVQRDANVALHIRGAEYPMRAQIVPEADPAWARAQQAFRDKYGTSDRLLGMLPGAGTQIMRVVPR